MSLGFPVGKPCPVYSLWSTGPYQANDSGSGDREGSVCVRRGGGHGGGFRRLPIVGFGECLAASAPDGRGRAYDEAAPGGLGFFREFCAVPSGESI